MPDDAQVPRLLPFPSLKNRTTPPPQGGHRPPYRYDTHTSHQMNKLIQTIELMRGKLDGLRRRGLKETQTRISVVDPILEALGWDVRDPDEVESEYTTVDGKSVDYALKLNKKAVLFIEAKTLDDPLNDVKAITQVVGYAANAGIASCVLTNGVTWKIYRSMEKCSAPEKLMYEVNLAPKDSEGMTVQQLAERLWRFSCDEIAKGTLDDLGEQTFTDGKVRKALNGMMSEPPRKFLNLIRSALRDESLTPQRIKQSLARIVKESATTESIAAPTKQPQERKLTTREPADRSQAARNAMPRRGKARKGESSSDEAHHIAGKPQETIELYRALDRLCLAIDPGRVSKQYLAQCINYNFGKRSFCSVRIQRGGLRVWLRLKYGRIEAPPDFARDVSNIGHWGNGDLQLDIGNRSQLDEAAGLIRMSFDSQQ